MQSTIAARRHGLSVQQAPEALEIEGDEVRLVQIVTNLLTNAVKYTPEGGQLCITTKRDSNAAALCVADNGSGLAPEMLTQVFELFTQGPRDHARPSVGLGIGLTLVKRLTELHGGTIQARSEGPGRGSEFSVRLPLAAGGEGVPAASEVADHDREARAKRVMVVDDNHDVADSLAVALGTTAGHAVRQAYDGRSALEMAAIFAPDVVVLDIGLPDMDGYAVARELRKQASTASARLIALTGYGNDVAVARSAEAGFDHHLVEPVSLAQLQAVIEGKERAAK
jgi:two-component system CheB/CheR fusion protein